MVIVPLLYFLLNFLIRYCDGTCKGCVELDELTFDKLVKRFPATLVKFDIAYPYGDKHEAYSSFAADVAEDVDDLMVAVVGIKDYGEKDNAALGKRFSVKENYPDIKLFTSNFTWIDYPADNEINSDNLKQFIREYTSIYIGLPGCIEELDKLANGFIKNFQNDKSSYIKDAETMAIEFADEKQKSTANVYITVMKKVQEKGISFIQAERQRVKQLLTGKITDTKKKELNLRLNILKAFEVSNEQIKTEL